ncbi:MAG: hypothetical protein ACE5IR_19555 [bacterium]
MHRKQIPIIAIAIILSGVAFFLLAAGDGESMKGMIIFTQIAVDKAGGNPSSEESWRYPDRSRIVALNSDAPQGTVHVLTEAFHSARSPEISYDGKRLLFAGQQHEGDPWHIWEMKLPGREVKQITEDKGCTDPAYLPDGRIIFSAFNSNLRYETEKTDKTVNALYTCNLDGSGVERITFHPESDFAPTLLRDGRVLFVSSNSDRAIGGSKLLAMRYDGMWVELFYENMQTGWQNCRVRETDKGELIFVESSQKDSFGGRLIAISNKRPLHSRVNLAPDLEGTFHSVTPLPSGYLIVAYQPPETDSYALYEFDPVKKQLGRLIYGDSESHAVEPIAAEEHARPKTFVSLVDAQKTSALLYCLDANRSALPVNSALPASTPGVKVQVIDAEGVLGEVPLEEDGSFYLEVPTDRPLRFQTASEDGQVVRGPSSWIWARPNEKRGCIGCHEDRELAPENRAPLAITKPPVSLLSRLTSLAAGDKPAAKEMAK